MTAEGVSRRSFLKGAGGLAAAGRLAQDALAQAQAGAAGTLRQEGELRVLLKVNGRDLPVQVEPRTTLLNALRNHAEPPLTGAKLVCDRGTCGACTVLSEEGPIYACMVLAADFEGRAIRTVEGLAEGGELSPVQDAFCRHDATMCGFCTPGFVMAVQACLERNPEAGEEEIRAACAGNLCRCGTQPQVFAAALDARASFQAAAGEAR
jgi:xanthine dehydrogenase YagT iron-sulfur-binding subunit